MNGNKKSIIEIQVQIKKLKDYKTTLINATVREKIKITPTTD